MSILSSINSRSTDFTRHSDTESVCNACFATLKADRFLPIAVAEEIHADLCLATHDSPSEFAL